MALLIEAIFTTYAFLCLLHLGLQMALAQAHHLRRGRTPCGSQASDDGAISVIYPIYNEDPDVLRLVLERARRCLCLPGLEIILVDDGSPNRALLEPIYDEFRDDGVRVIYQENRGKRQAQYAALAVAKGDFIVTVDSDTLIDAEGVRRLIAPMRRDARIGAVCGDVVVENWRVNPLTRLIGLRYWTAFHLERAAQSFFGSVLCCSGPFSAYRADLLHRIKDAYVGQTFWGRRCTYGDDRHLTNLVLGESHRVVFEPGAIGRTWVPDSLSEYIKQQNRWNKSFYREILWTLKIADRVHPYAMLDMLLQPLLFVGFSLSLSYSVLVFWETTSWLVLAYYVLALVAMSAFRAAYGLLRTFDARFFLFLLYGFLHVFVLVPVRFKSILTLSDNRWGTRAASAQRPYRDFSIWCAGYVAMLLAIASGLAFALPRESGIESLAGAIPIGGVSEASSANLPISMCYGAALLASLAALSRYWSWRAQAPRAVAISSSSKVG